MNCAYHPERAAVAQCTECGKGLVLGFATCCMSANSDLNGRKVLL